MLKEENILIRIALTSSMLSSTKSWGFAKDSSIFRMRTTARQGMKPEITSPGNNRGLFATIRDRLAKRPDTEHQAAIIRLAIAVVSGIYLITAVQLSAGYDSDGMRHVMALLVV